MPGESYRGTPPPLSAELAAVQDRLRGHVVMLASEIGERNQAHYVGLERARAYIAQQLEAAGYVVRHQPYVYGGRTFHNAEAVTAEPGGGASVVIGAHYDSAEGSPGANDNASGVAALIELARLLRDKPVKTPIRFVAFANEEAPYFSTGEGMGSAEYVKRFPHAAERIRFMLSLETIGWYSDEPGSQRYPAGVGLFYPDRGNFIGFVANPASRGLLRQLIGEFRRVATIPSEGAALPEFIPGIAWSDHRSFWRAGIPAVMVTDTALFRDPAYHTAADTAERLDYEKMVRVVDGLAHAVSGR
ncbi:MAG: M20/M25/M40 family metallo-hydrolase [Candidatus Binatia bacterium]